MHYQIKIRQTLDATWDEWFAPLAIQPQPDDTTLLCGDLSDQTALHSVLNKIRNLNLELLSVTSASSPDIDMVLSRRDSLRAKVTWIGTLIHIHYNAVIFAFATAFHPFFLLYVTTLSLAVWSLVALLAQRDADTICAYFAEKTPVRFFAGYLAVVSLLFLSTWLKQIIPAMFDPAALPDAVPLFTGFTAIGLVVTVTYPDFLCEKSNSKERLA